MIIKQIPEDFVVEEIPYDYFSRDNGEGAYTYFTLKKINIDSFSAVERAARALKRKPKDISIAGIKDKKAITSQVCSVKGKIKEYSDDLIEIKVLGRGARPVSSGFIKGNRFRIVARGLPQGYKIKRNAGCIPNYYDSQRFGIDKNNILIGKGIVKRDFSPVLNALGCKGLNELKRKDLAKKVKFFLSSYVSILFNKTLQKIIKEEHNETFDNFSLYQSFIVDKPNEQQSFMIPIAGFGLEQEMEELKEKEPGHYEQIKRIIAGIMDEEGICESDFIIREFPEISCESVLRNAFIDAAGFSVIEQGKDELNEGREKIILGFEIPSGSYATVVLKDLFADVVFNDGANR